MAGDPAVRQLAGGAARLLGLGVLKLQGGRGDERHELQRPRGKEEGGGRECILNKYVRCCGFHSIVPLLLARTLRRQEAFSARALQRLLSLSLCRF